MATLQKIRQRGVLLTVIIGLALLAFIIGGIDFNSISGNSRMIVGEVDGNDVKIQEYERLLEEMTTFYKLEMGQSSLDEAATNQIRNAVWNMWVNEQLIAEQCEELGIVVTDDEIADNLSSVSPHPMLARLRMFYNAEKQAFDSALLVEFARMIASGNATADMYSYWSYIQRSIKNQLLQDKYSALVGASFNFNNLETQEAYNDKQAYSIEYVSAPYFSKPDSVVSVSDKEIKELYSKEKENLNRKIEERGIGIIAFDIEPSQEDYDEVKQWCDKVWAEFSTSADYVGVCNQNSDVAYDGIAVSRAAVDKDLADFAFSAKTGEGFAPKLFGKTYKMARIAESGISAPDSVKARHILVMELSEDRTKAVADSLIGLINSGADFEALAKQYSKAGTAANGGELGWFREGEIDKGFSEACFKAQTGKAFIYPMGQTLQVVQVTEKTKPVEKVKICILQREVEPSSKTYARLFNDANQYAAKYNNSQAFADSAKTLDGVYYRTYTVKSSDNTVAGIKDSRQVIRWAFEASTGDVADKVFECGDKFVLASLTSVMEEGIPPYEEVSGKLRQQIVKEKKGAVIALEMQEKLQGDNLASLGQVRNVASTTPDSRFISGLGSEPKVSGSLKKLAESGKIGFIEGNAAVYAVKVTKLADSRTSYNAEALARELSGKRPHAQMVLQSLNEAADITDNRIRFY